MTTSAERYRAYHGPALFSMGFRPFFLFAALWAAIGVPIWIAAFAGLLPISEFSRDWHVHEMLFGYLGGVVAGFLLTAVPNWTGRLPVAGAPLAALFALWVAGRIAMLFAQALGTAAAVVDVLFLFALAGVVTREVLAASNKRNLPICVLVVVLALANLASHQDGALGLFGERAGLAVIAMLVALIGGRIVPSFTRNWMTQRKLAPPPAAVGGYDTATLAATALALASWLFAPQHAAVGIALLAAGVLNAVRLARWRGWRTAAEPLVLILHFGYGWLALALVLIGLSILAPAAVPYTAGIHALTAGAFGVMTLAVMTRASLGHTGRALVATPPITALYALVNLGAALRTFAPFAPDFYLPLLAAAAAAWSGAFLVFFVVYAPIMLRDRPKAAA